MCDCRNSKTLFTTPVRSATRSFEIPDPSQNAYAPFSTASATGSNLSSRSARVSTTVIEFAVDAGTGTACHVPPTHDDH